MMDRLLIHNIGRQLKKISRGTYRCTSRVASPQGPSTALVPPHRVLAPALVLGSGEKGELVLPCGEQLPLLRDLIDCAMSASSSAVRILLRMSATLFVYNSNEL